MDAESQWKEYINTPEDGFSKSGTINMAATPSRLRALASEGNSHTSEMNGKKRGPSTPLTPTLVQKNIVKKQLSSFEREHNRNVSDVDTEIQEDVPKTIGPHYFNTRFNQSINDEINNQEKQERYIFSESNKGSPVSKKSTPLSVRSLEMLNQNHEIVTPKIRNGIKRAVRESKKNRLQVLKDLHLQDSNPSDSEYSEISTIAGDTPNYKIQNENLIYYKNGYYLNNDDSIYESEKENVINTKEIHRVNDLLEFMKLERQFENDMQ